MRAPKATHPATAPTSANPATGAVNGATVRTNAVTGTDTSAGVPTDADAATPPRPHPRVPHAGTPAKNQKADQPKKGDICMCGCGMKVRPGRAFLNREHQTRWMSLRQRPAGSG
jgi:hypothetical protein